MAKFSVSPAQRAQDRRRGSLVPRGIMFLMYRTRNSPVLYIRTPLSIGPGLCELRRNLLLGNSVNRAWRCRPFYSSCGSVGGRVVNAEGGGHANPNSGRRPSLFLRVAIVFLAAVLVWLLVVEGLGPFFGPAYSDRVGHAIRAVLTSALAVPLVALARRPGSSLPRSQAVGRASAHLLAPRVETAAVGDGLLAGYRGRRLGHDVSAGLGEHLLRRAERPSPTPLHIPAAPGVPLRGFTGETRLPGLLLPQPRRPLRALDGGGGAGSPLHSLGHSHRRGGIGGAGCPLLHLQYRPRRAEGAHEQPVDLHRLPPRLPVGDVVLLGRRTRRFRAGG